MAQEERQGEMERPRDPTRLKKRGIIALGAVAAALLTGYAALCAWAGAGDRLPPRVTVAGMDVGGMNRSGAQQAVAGELSRRQAALSVEFSCNGTLYTVPGRDFTAGTAAALEELAALGKGPFPLLGAQYLAALIVPRTISVSFTLDKTPPAVEQAAWEQTDPAARTTWELEGEDALVFTRGRRAPAVEVAGLLAELSAEGTRLLNGGGPQQAPVEARMADAEPAEPDFAAIRAQIETTAADAYFDPETREIVPSVVGRTLSGTAETQARQALREGEAGARVKVQLTITPPQVTTEALAALIYRDVLGEASTHVGGSASRVGNVKLAGEYLNGTVLLPGEVFSYLAACGPYETEKGYGMGAAYLNGKTVLTPGGGVCQGASTLYLATLRANLETVERQPHGYEPSYIPAGLDATVAGSEIDFKFKNNTEYPVKIETWMDGESCLHVKLLGTNTTGIHGEPYSANRKVTKYADTVYEPDESVPQGTTRKDGSRTAYNAVSAEAYLKLVDAAGNVVDTLYLHKDNYHARNAVIFYNPADAAALGVDPATGRKSRTPEPTPSPTATPAPAATPDPDTSLPPGAEEE